MSLDSDALVWLRNILCYLKTVTCYFLNDVNPDALVDGWRKKDTLALQIRWIITICLPHRADFVNTQLTQMYINVWLYEMRHSEVHLIKFTIPLPCYNLPITLQLSIRDIEKYNPRHLSRHGDLRDFQKNIWKLLSMIYISATRFFAFVCLSIVHLFKCPLYW